MTARSSLAVLGVGLLVAGCRHAPPSDPAEAIAVTTSPVGRGDVTAHVTLRGRLVPRSEEDVTLAAQVPGRLVRVDAREGDLVPAGAVLAIVDHGPLDETERTAVAALAKAREEEAVKARAAELTARLVARGIASREEQANDEAALEASRASRVEADVRLAQARRSRSWAEVRVPFTAVVAQLLRRAGETVDGTPTTPIARLLGTSTQEVSADATAADLARVHIGDAAVLHIGTGQEVTGHVLRVSRAVDAVTGVGEVRVRLDGRAPIPLLAPVTVVVNVAVHRGALTVPLVALRRSEAGLDELVVVEKGAAKVRAVKVGLQEGDRAEVLGGLDGTETIVVDSPLGLVDGVALTLRRAVER